LRSNNGNKHGVARIRKPRYQIARGAWDYSPEQARQFVRAVKRLGAEQAIWQA
jgi:hypothetical protein